MLPRPLRAAAPIGALALLAACEKDPVVEVIPGVHGSVEVALINPTECPACDPFEGVDTLRLEVRSGDDVVASDTFAWPGEAVTLPDLTAFGVVRFTLLGLSSGRVVSAGRTPEVVLLPDVATTVPMVFLPANRALPLSAPMSVERYHARAIVRRGGDVVLVGGLDPTRRRATDVVEVYDPSTGTFAELGTAPVAAAGPTVAALPDGQWLVSGGYAVANDAEVPLPDGLVFDDATGTFTEAAALSVGRADHCVAMFRERQGLALGGADAEADYLKPDPTTGAWAFESLEMRDFVAPDVTGCAVVSEGRIYVQGRDAGSTGLWAEDSSEDLSEAFRGISEGAAGDFRYVTGARLLPTADGAVRILGGADVATGEVFADGRLYAPDARRFEIVEGFASPRYDADLVGWLEPGWYVAGCGWADAARATGEATIELLEPETGERGPLVPLDRDREGCALATLPDGAVLVVGGGPEGVPTGADAALVVPWIDLPEGG